MPELYDTGYWTPGAGHMISWISDTGCWIWDIGWVAVGEYCAAHGLGDATYWIPDTRCGIVDVGCRKHYIGWWRLDTEDCVLDITCWIIDVGKLRHDTDAGPYMTLDIGHWIQGAGHWR